jgi:hypothetical protein
MRKNVLREITPLTQNDCFTLFSRVKTEFDFPLHYHEEYELNFIQHGKGARRIIGDHIEEIDDIELVLVGPNLQHGWFTNKCTNKDIKEITIQFHKDLFDEKFLRRNQLSFMRMMLERSARGILFSKETALQVAPRRRNSTRNMGLTPYWNSSPSCTTYQLPGTCAYSRMPHLTIQTRLVTTAGGLKRRMNL